MKKKLSVLFLLPLLLTGCNNGSSDSGAAKPSNEPTPIVPDVSNSNPSGEYVPQIKEKTTIELWSITGQNNQVLLQSYIDEFRKLEPNVTVTNTIQTGMGYNELKSAVVTKLATGDYPDRVQCYPDHVAEYINYGKAVNLDPYIKNPTYGWTQEDKDDIYPAFLEEGSAYAVDGTYSVPYCKSTEARYYNKGVLVGLDLHSIDPTINGGKSLDEAYFNDLTWEELFGKLSPALIKYNSQLPDDKKILKSDDKYHAVFAYDSDDNLFITLAKQYGIGYTSIGADGKGHFDFGEGENKTKRMALLTKFHEYKEKGYLITKGLAEGNYTNAYFNTQNTLFSVGSTGGYKYQFSAANPMDVGVAPIPHAQGKDLAIINQGPSLTILDHDDENRKLASWLLYKTITNKENCLDWAINSGYMGIRKSVTESEDYQEAATTRGKDLNTLDRLLARNRTYSTNEKVLNSLYVSPAFLGSSTARSQVSGVLTNALTSTKTGAEYQAELNKLFDDARNACLLAVK